MFRKLFTAPSKTKPIVNNRKNRLQPLFDRLEDRVVPAFTAGNLAVLLGDGTTSAATAVHIVEYDTTTANQASPVTTTDLPTTAAAAPGNGALTQSGSATSEGIITRTQDKRYLLVTGYNVTAGTAGVTGSTADRIVGRIDANQNVDTTTRAPGYSGNNIRSAGSKDGSTLYVGGPGPGLTTLTFGTQPASATAISSVNSRMVGVFGDQLWDSSGSSPNVGVNKVGSGLPTSAATATLIAAAGSNNFNYYMLDRDGTAGMDELYIADNTNGLVKYSSADEGSTWTSKGSITSVGTVNGVAIAANGSGTDIYFTTGGAASAANKLQKITDSAAYNATASGGTITTLATAPAGKVFRSVTFTPESVNPGSLGFSATSYSVNENAGTATITVQRTGGTAGAVSVHYATSNGTATAGSDYTATSGDLNWADGDTADKTFTIPITDDSTQESNETVHITLSSATGGASIAGTNPVDLTIVDNDNGGTLVFSAASYSVNENAGTATITVQRTVGSSGAISVHYATSNGTATAGSDYTATSGDLTWTDGETADKTFTVAITNDSVFEANEAINLTLSSAVGATIGSPNPATLTIIDDDAPASGSILLNEIDVNPPSTDNPYEYVEVAGANNGVLGNVYFVSLEGDSGANPGQATMVTNLSSATLGSNGLLVIKSPSGGFSIPGGTTVVTDSTLDTSGGGLQNGTNSFAIVWAPAGLSNGTDYDTNNDGTLDLPSGAQVLDGFGWTDGDSGDIVYGPALTQLTPTPDAATRVVGNTTPNSAAAWYLADLVDGGSPSLNVQYDQTKSSPNLPAGAVLTPGAANDQGPAAGTIRFAGGTFLVNNAMQYSVAENAGNLVITVQRVGGSTGAISVDYTTQDLSGDGAATAGSDYTTTSGTLNWAAGNTADKTITIPIINDSDIEGNEFFRVTLSNATNGAQIGGNNTDSTQAFAQVTITDDDITAPTDLVLNELDVNPPSTDNPYEYIEIRGGTSEILRRVYLVGINGDSGSTLGEANYVLPLDGAMIGSNGLLMVKSPTGGFTPLDIATTIITDAQLDNSGGKLENGTQTFMLLFSNTTITGSTDFDTNNDGSLDLPSGTTVVDSVGWSDGGAGDAVYGGVTLTQTSGTPDAATRYPNNTTANSVFAWYNGDLLDNTTNHNDSVTYDTTKASLNLPNGTPVLTPGGANYPTSGTAPSITSGSSASVGTNQLGTFQVVATGSPAPTYRLSGAPSWVWIDPRTGQLGFAAPPGTTGSPFHFDIIATNGIGTDADQAFTLTVTSYTPVAFAPGNLLVYRVGDGTAYGSNGSGGTASGVSAAIFVDEYTPAGVYVQSVPAPSSISGSISAVSEGMLSLSADGHLVAFDGYNAAPGTANISGTDTVGAAGGVLRVIGTVNPAGTFTVATTTTAYELNNFRSAATVDGKEFWTAGTSSAGGGNGQHDGVRYYNLPGAANGNGVGINNTFNTRTVALFPGANGMQLYWGTASTFGSGPGIYDEQNLGVVTPFPTTLVAGADTQEILDASNSPYQFAVVDMGSGNLRAYFVDDGTGTGATPGLYRVDYTGFWGSPTLIASNFTDVRGLTAVKSGSNVILYGTRASDTIAGVTSFATSLVTLTDTGAFGESWTTATSFANFGGLSTPVLQMRGITVVPQAAGANTATDSVTASPNPVQASASTTITAALTGDGSHGTPTGFVSFIDHATGTTLLTAPLVSGSASYATSFANVGDVQIDVYYGGDSHYAAHTDPVTVHVTGNATTTVVTSNAANPNASNQTVTLTATVSTGVGTATGSVQFYDNLLPIGSPVTLNGSGVATLDVQTAALASSLKLTPGIHSIYAVFTPTGTYVASTGVMSQKVIGNAFGASDVLVYRVGDGTSSVLVLTGSPVFVDEYNASGTLIQTFAFPIADTGTGANAIHALVAQGQQSSTGQLSLSGNNHYAFLTGYDATPPTTGDIRAANSLRTIGRISFDGTVSTGVVLSDVASGTTNINAIYSPDGNSFYIGGTATGAASGGIRYEASYTPSENAQTSLPVAIGIGLSTKNVIALHAFGGQLFVDSTSAGLRIGKVGTGLPVPVQLSISDASESGTTVTITTSAANTIATGQAVFIAGISPSGYDGTFLVTRVDSTHFTYTAAASLGTATVTGATAIGLSDITPLPGVSTVSGTVPKFPVDFYMADLDGTASYASTGLDTLYIGDDGAGFNNGSISKWTWTGSAWVQVGEIDADPISTPGYYYLQGSTSGSTVTLYATYGQGGTGNTGQGALYSVTDSNGYVNPTAISITGTTISGSTATATTSSAHGLHNGDKVIIFGVTGGTNAANYNGAFVISNVTTNTFDYTVIGALPTAAGTGGTATPNTLGSTSVTTVATVSSTSKENFRGVAAIPFNTPPVITTGANQSVAENNDTVVGLGATDADGDPLTFSIAGGADAALFQLDGSGTVLHFINPPDFENPQDANADNVYEVTIQLSDGFGGIVTKALHVTVTDVAAGTIVFSSATYSTAEGDSGTHTVTITVSRSGGDDATSVHYATSDGTATTADNDYDAASGTLSWAAGDTADKTFTVTIHGDTTVESDETVNLDLSSPTAGATLGSPHSAVLTITNDDASGTAPAVTSVVVNGGPIYAVDALGDTPALAGQNSVVEQLLVTFNEAVTLDSGVFSIDNLFADVTVNGGLAPSHDAVGVVATAVSGSGNTQYVLTFTGGVNTFDNSASGNGGVGNVFTTIKDGFYQLNVDGSKVHANSQTASSTTAKFWAVYGANNPGDFAVSGTLGDGNSEVTVGNGGLGDLYAGYGSESDIDGPYAAPYDFNLDGFIDNGDLTPFYSNYGIDWTF